MSLTDADIAQVRDVVVGEIEALMLPRFDKHDKRFDAHDNRFDSLLADMAEVKADVRALKTDMREVKLLAQEADIKLPN